jgi:predicted transcriptional regulator
MCGSNFNINYGVIMSAKTKVLSYLSKTGQYNTLTASKMQSVFGIKNPSAVVNELRNEGHAIYLNTRKTASGEKVSFYRLGTPTKRMVAAGIQSLRQHGFSTFA